MKRFLFLLTVLALASCKGAVSSSGPEQAAKTFLTAYFTADFAVAAPLCTAALQEDMNRSLDFFDSLTEAEQAQIRSDLRAYLFKMEKTQLNSGKDSATVSYRVFLQDSTGITARGLRLIKQEESWKVDKFL